MDNINHMILFFTTFRNFCFRWPLHVGVGFGFFILNVLKLPQLSSSLHLFSLKKSNFFEVSYLMSHFNHSLLHSKIRSIFPASPEKQPQQNSR